MKNILVYCYNTFLLSGDGDSGVNEWEESIARNCSSGAVHLRFILSSNQFKFTMWGLNSNKIFTF